MSFPHPFRRRRTGALVASLVLAAAAAAQPLLPPTPVPLDSPAAFQAPSANWQPAGGLAGDPRTEKFLTPAPGTGVLVNNPTAAARGHLLTAWEHGDLELDLDFLLPPGSNSGVYLMGRYEVQLFHSWGVATPTAADCGGLYQRWEDARGKGHEGFEGAAPRANASRAPGLWQHLHIEFQAPRFDAAGKKTAHARFRRVVLNDFVIHENVEVTGPTRASPYANEVPLAPLLIQGDHGPVAVRNLAAKRFDPALRATVEGLAYKLYAVEPTVVGEYDATPPKAQGVPARFAGDAVEQTGKFALVLTGTLVAPRAGPYAFATRASEPVRLLVDGQPALLPFDDGGQPVALTLAAGPHAFRLDYVHSSKSKPGFNLTVEGPGLAPQELTVNEPPKPDAAKPRDPRARELLIAPPAGRIRMQRSFVPFEPKKRLYAINVGSPDGLHYAYDFETAALLRVWRGGFLDTFEMWDGRGENQLAKPAGPALTLSARPVLALLERTADDWPEQPDAMWSSQGYHLEPDGTPTFLFKLASLSATDRIAPAPASHGVTRTLVVEGWTTSWEPWVLLAEAAQITPQPGGRGYIVGDRAYYLDLPADAVVQPFVRTRHGRQQLVVPIGKATLGKPITYTLVW